MAIEHPIIILIVGIAVGQMIIPLVKYIWKRDVGGAISTTQCMINQKACRDQIGKTLAATMDEKIVQIERIIELKISLGVQDLGNTVNQAIQDHNQSVERFMGKSEVDRASLRQDIDRLQERYEKHINGGTK